MPKPILQVTWWVLYLSTALLATAQSPAPGQPVTAAVDAAKTGPPISPYVYGQFLEHAGNLIYGGLWSEMLDDRKFYYAVAPAPAGGPNPRPTRVRRRARTRRARRRRPGTVESHWPGSIPLSMDTNTPYVGEHTPLILLANSEPRGMRQTGLNFIKDATYNGRVQLAGDPTAKVSRQHRLGHQRRRAAPDGFAR